jgi:hypothetical protein
LHDSDIARGELTVQFRHVAADLHPGGAGSDAGSIRGPHTSTMRSCGAFATANEFEKKADKSGANSNTETAARDAVIELEQAGDSAKAAVEADLGASEATRQAVLDAHLAICILKTEV